MNSFTTALRAELNEALWRAETDSAVRAVVLTGAGRVPERRSRSQRGSILGLGNRAPIAERIRISLRAIATMPKPVLAGVAGFAAGIGVSYVLASDLVVMGSSGYLLVPFSRIGLVPDGGLGALLGRLPTFTHRAARALPAKNRRRFSTITPITVGSVVVAVPLVQRH